MYATAARGIFNETGQLKSVSNGVAIWNAMRRMTIPGRENNRQTESDCQSPGMISNTGIGSGTIMLDDLAERVPFFSAFYVDGAGDRVCLIHRLYRAICLR